MLKRAQHIVRRDAPGSDTSVIKGALLQPAQAVSASPASLSESKTPVPSATPGQQGSALAGSSAAGSAESHTPPASAAQAERSDSKELPQTTSVKEYKDTLSAEMIAEIDKKLADVKSETELFKTLEKSKESPWIFDVGAYRFDEFETKQLAASPYNIKIENKFLIVTNPQNFILETSQNQNDKVNRLVYINPETQDRINICSFSDDPTISAESNFQNHLSYRVKTEKKHDGLDLKLTDGQLTKILDRGTSFAQEGEERGFIIDLINKQITHAKQQFQNEKKLTEFKQALDIFYQDPYEAQSVASSPAEVLKHFDAPTIQNDLPKLKTLLEKQHGSIHEETKPDPNVIAEHTLQIKLLEKKYSHLIAVDAKLSDEKKAAIGNTIQRLGLEGNIGIVQSREEYDRNIKNAYCDWPLSRFFNGHIKILEDGAYPTDDLASNPLNQQAGALDVFSEGKQYPCFNVFLDDRFVPIACAPSVTLAQHMEDAKKRVAPYRMPENVKGCGDLTKTKSEGKTREESKDSVETVHKRLAKNIRRNNPIGTIKWIPKTHRILVASKEHSEFSELVVFAMDLKGEAASSSMHWAKQQMTNCGSNLYHTSNAKSSCDFHDRFKGIKAAKDKHSITFETCDPHNKQSYCHLYVNCSYAVPIQQGLSSLDAFATPPVESDEDLFKSESAQAYNHHLNDKTIQIVKDVFAKTDPSKTLVQQQGVIKLVSNPTHEMYAVTKENWGNIVALKYYDGNLDEQFWITWNDPLRFEVSPGATAHEQAIDASFKMNMLPWIQCSEFKDQLKKAIHVGNLCLSLDMNEEKLKVLITNYLDACTALYKNPDSLAAKKMYKTLHDQLRFYMPVFEDLTKLDIDCLLAAMLQTSPEYIKYKKAKKNLAEATRNGNLIDGLKRYRVGIEELFVQLTVEVSASAGKAGVFGKSDPAPAPTGTSASAAAPGPSIPPSMPVPSTVLKRRYVGRSAVGKRR